MSALQWYLDGLKCRYTPSVFSGAKFEGGSNLSKRRRPAGILGVLPAQPIRRFGAKLPNLNHFPYDWSTVLGAPIPAMQRPADHVARRRSPLSWSSGRLSMIKSRYRFGFDKWLRRRGKARPEPLLSVYPAANSDR